MSMIDWVTTDELAKILHITRNQVYGLVRGGMPHIKVSTKCFLFDKAEVETWLRSNVDRIYKQDKMEDI